MKEKKAKDPGLVRFELSSPHTHRGELKQSGDKITIRDDQAKRLAEQDRGVIVSGK